MFKFVIFLIILSMSYDSNACSCAPYMDIERNPLTAKTILVIKFKGEPFDQSLFTEKPWPFLEKKMMSYGCPAGGENGKKYLFLSRQNIEDLRGSKNKVIGSCSGLIHDLSSAEYVRVIKQLATAKELPVGHPNVFWGFCQKDIECTKIKKSCGDVNSVNKKYKSNLETYINESGNKCDRKDVKGKISKCVESFCS